MRARTILRLLILLLPALSLWDCDLGSCQQGGTNPFVWDFPRKGQSTAALFFSSVACKCVLERCQRASAACDSVFADSVSSGKSGNYDFVKVDIFEEEILEKRFEVKKVPTLVIFNSEGIETARIVGIISTRTIKETLRQLEEE